MSLSLITYRPSEQTHTTGQLDSEHPAGSYHDRYLVDEAASPTSVLPCVRLRVAHPQPSPVQDPGPGCRSWRRGPSSSFPSASPELGPASDCASSGSFCHACHGKKCRPRPGESGPRPPGSHGSTCQLTLEQHPGREEKKKRGEAHF